MQITNMAVANDVLMNKKFEEAFDFIKYVEKLYGDQLRLTKAFCNLSSPTQFLSRTASNSYLRLKTVVAPGPPY